MLHGTRNDARRYFLEPWIPKVSLSLSCARMRRARILSTLAVQVKRPSVVQQQFPKKSITVQRMPPQHPIRVEGMATESTAKKVRWF